jgi:hypothetical protein
VLASKDALYLNGIPMAYESIDQLQKALASSVFGHTEDRKKAAGRALGTLVEIVTYYLLKQWGLSHCIAIERGLPEYKNPGITHNVEYSLHPVKFAQATTVSGDDLPVTARKVSKCFGAELAHLREFEQKGHALLSKSGILRNACVLGERADVVLVGLIRVLTGGRLELDLVGQFRPPFAIFECKRVGVEEGQRKGPQTIEKAKQGAYVARAISCLQKIRVHSGELTGVISKRDGTLYYKSYEKLIDEVVHCNDPELLRDFILTVGIVSNHGNWFTSEDHNKELRVLAQSYDWLLFLTDAGLVQFVNDLILSAAPAAKPVRTAFAASYAKGKTENRFTKVQMDFEADRVLQCYFKSNIRQIEGWFNVIAPYDRKRPGKFTIKELKEQIKVLSEKDWNAIFSK